MLVVSPFQEPALAAAVDDFNRALAQEGCSACAYHLYKLFVGKYGQFNYMMTSDWPSADVYVRIHSSPSYSAANRRNPVMSELAAGEFYGRYIRVK